MTFTTTTSATTDREELVARVAELERVQLAEDVEGFLALFDEDAVWVTGGGMRLIGRDAIATFTRTVLPGWRRAAGDQSARYVVEHIRFITPDVALTAVNQEYLTADGEPLSPRMEGRPTYTWQRRGSQWLIVAGQNTAVPAADTGGSVPALSEKDEEEIGQIVADVERGFNTNDPEPMMRRVADDAVVVNAVGAVQRGREEIDRVTRAALADGPLRAASAHYRLTGITALAPDIAVAHKDAWATPEAAESGAAPEMKALYVLARRDGRWWIVRRQNTLVHATT